MAIRTCSCKVPLGLVGQITGKLGGEPVLKFINVFITFALWGEGD